MNLYSLLVYIEHNGDESLKEQLYLVVVHPWYSVSCLPERFSFMQSVSKTDGQTSSEFFPIKGKTNFSIDLFPNMSGI